LDSARKLLKEEKMIILLDNLEVKVLVYFLTDLILICESDEKSETWYKTKREKLLLRFELIFNCIRYKKSRLLKYPV
jgi:hypothetical protein